MSTKTTTSVVTTVGGRKVLGFVIAILVTLALALLGKLNDTAMWTIVSLYASLSVPNAIEHFAGAMKTFGKRPVINGGQNGLDPDS